MKRIRTKKLWRLLEMAIDDAQRMRRRKDVTLSMGDWLRFTNEGCFACLAGCVMLANGATWDDANAFDSVGPRAAGADGYKYRAIDWMRVGEFVLAYQDVHQAFVPEQALEVLREAQLSVDSTFRRENNLADWRSYRKAIRILKAANL